MTTKRKRKRKEKGRRIRYDEKRQLLNAEKEERKRRR